MKQVMQLLLGSGDATTDRERFIRACIFNFIVLGIDAHAKNYSVLIEHGGRFRLAPLYDLISALPYDHEEFNILAMKVGGEGYWRDIGRSHWEREAVRCGYSETAALAYLEQQLETLPAAAVVILKEVEAAGLNSSGVLSKFVEQLERRCAKLRLRFAH